VLQNKAVNVIPLKRKLPMQGEALHGQGWHYLDKWGGMILLKEKGRVDNFKITAVILKLNNSLSLPLPLQHIIEAISLPHYQQILL